MWSRYHRDSQPLRGARWPGRNFKMFSIGMSHASKWSVWEVRVLWPKSFSKLHYMHEGLIGRKLHKDMLLWVTRHGVYLHLCISVYFKLCSSPHEQMEKRNLQRVGLHLICYPRTPSLGLAHLLLHLPSCLVPSCLGCLEKPLCLLLLLGLHKMKQGFEKEQTFVQEQASYCRFAPTCRCQSYSWPMMIW